MKTQAALIFLFILTLADSVQAQESLARIEYGYAESAFQNQQYEEALQHLDKVKELLGSSNQRVMYLEILCYSGLYSIETINDQYLAKSPFWNYSPADFKKVDSLSKVYISHFDASAPLEKIKKVYEISQITSPLAINAYDVEKAIKLLKIKGTVENFDEAEKLLNKSCEMGNTYACNVLDHYLIPLRDLVESLVPVEGGTFTMGSDGEEGYSNYTLKQNGEKPAHTVTVSSFSMMKTEITKAMARAMAYIYLDMKKITFDIDLNSLPQEEAISKLKIISTALNTTCSECPMGSLSYTEINKLCTSLSKMTGINFRLPTEAEWEFAAKGGNKSQGYIYPGSNIQSEVAQPISPSSLSPVAQLKPNELGLYDMSGSVKELCQDFFDEKYYKNSPENNPVNLEATSEWVVVRGEWRGRIFTRDKLPKSMQSWQVGFRLVARP